MNHGPQYVPFHVVNRDRVTVPVKYIKVKMTKMPRKYRQYAKMPKGWKMEEVRDDEVEEVWDKQKRALFDSTTPGRLTRSASRSRSALSLPFPVDSK